MITKYPCICTDILLLYRAGATQRGILKMERTKNIALLTAIAFTIIVSTASVALTFLPDYSIY